MFERPSLRPIQSEVAVHASGLGIGTTQRRSRSGKEYVPMLRVMTIAGAVGVLLVGAALADAQEKHTMAATNVQSLKWAPIQPPGFDAGMEIAVILGDPAVPNQPYTVRLRFGDGYRFPAHYHPKAENLTVLSGTFLLKMGTTPGGELTAYAPGDYLHIPPEQPHYGGAKGATVIQLHGEGPFEIILAKPAATGGTR
jgi:quercetin dioxygenase-like cupin family protein